MNLTVKPRDLMKIPEAMDDATIALRSARGLKPKQPDNFGMFTSDTILDIYHSATSGIFARSRLASRAALTSATAVAARTSLTVL